MSIAVVLPARSADLLLRGALSCLAEQTRLPDEVVVVDDSTAGTLVLPVVPALAGRLRVEFSGGGGPYAARNVGWSSSGCDLVLFMDTRSRPRPDWVTIMAAAMVPEDVVFCSSEVLVSSGEGLGGLASEVQQFFRVDNYVKAPFFRPYFPTCNLAVRRRHLTEVGGFAERRSGADADLCWRLLDLPQARYQVIRETLMDWVPRTSSLQFLEQNYRYGKSHHALCVEWAARGAKPRDMSGRLQVGRRMPRAVARVVRASLRGQQGEAARALVSLGSLVLQAGYHTAAMRSR